MGLGSATGTITAAEKKQQKNRKKKERQRKNKATRAALEGGARATGLLTVELPVEESEEEEEEDGTHAFGERVSLTTRIHQILGGYPDGTTILKELVQNVSAAPNELVLRSWPALNFFLRPRSRVWPKPRATPRYCFWPKPRATPRYCAIGRRC